MPPAYLVLAECVTVKKTVKKGVQHRDRDLLAQYALGNVV